MRVECRIIHFDVLIESIVNDSMIVADLGMTIDGWECWLVVLSYHCFSFLQV